MPADEPAVPSRLEHLFEGIGTDRLGYAPVCRTLSGGWLQLETLISRSHDGGRWLAVDQAGACPDCSVVPVAVLDLPGFEPPSDLDVERPLRLQGRLSFGFSVDGEGQASFLRLEGARLVTGDRE